jgi:exosortase K
MNNIRNLKKVLSLPNVLLFTVVLICAYALKHHYSTAEAEGLKWILAPTATMVEILTGKTFFFDSMKGFVNYEYMVTIAKPCAGVNFLIIAFCMSTFNIILKVHNPVKKYVIVIGTFPALYLVTIVANTIRILIAIFLYTSHVEFGWFTPEKLHRLEGIAVYFIFLFMLNYAFLKYLEKVTEGNNSHV